MQIANVRRSTPTAALELLYNIPPLDLHIQETALKTAARLGICPKWVPTNRLGHQHELVRALPEIPRLNLDDRTTTTEWEMNYVVHIGDGKDIKRHDLTCYTDGSKMEGRTGVGAIIVQTERGADEIFCISSFSLGTCTVYQAEVKGILTAAEILLRNEFKTHFIDIMVDNQAALKALENPETKSDLVRETRTALNKLGRDNFVQLNWIEAHKRWHFNEIADKLAKKGCEPNCRRIGCAPGPNKKSIYNEIQKSTHQEWILRWNSSSDYRQSKYFLLAPSKAKSDTLLKYSKEVVSQVARFLTGHAFLRRQNKIVLTGMNPPPGDNSCRLCEDSFYEETPHHILTECDRLCSWRAETLGQCILEEFAGWHPRPLIKFLKLKMLISLETEEL